MQDDELEATSDSGISVIEGHPTVQHPDVQLQEVREHGGGDQQELSRTPSSSSKVNIILVTRKIKLRNIIQRIIDVLYINHDQE